MEFFFILDVKLFILPFLTQFAQQFTDNPVYLSPQVHLRQKMPNKTKSERKDMQRPASSVAAASDTNKDLQQVPVTQMEEALKKHAGYYTRNDQHQV